MIKVRFKTKPEGLRLFGDDKELPSGVQLELKIEQEWLFGTYIFDPNTNSHNIETMDQRRYQLDINSKLRFPPIRLNNFFSFSLYWFIAVINELQHYWRKRRNNQKGK